jgi:hypothetical protein
MGHVACMNLSDGTPKLNSSGDQQPRCAVTLVHVTTVPETLKSFFRGQVTHLKERGFQFIGVSSPGPDLDDFARREAVRTYGVPMIRGISLLHDLKSLLALWRLFRQIKPDIVHGSTPKAALLTMLAAVPARVPIRVYTLRGLMIEMPSGLTRGLFLWARMDHVPFGGPGHCCESVSGRHHGGQEVVHSRKATSARSRQQ